MLVWGEESLIGSDKILLNGWVDTSRFFIALEEFHGLGNFLCFVCVQALR